MDGRCISVGLSGAPNAILHRALSRRVLLAPARWYSREKRCPGSGPTCQYSHAGGGGGVGGGGWCMSLGAWRLKFERMC